MLVVATAKSRRRRKKQGHSRAETTQYYCKECQAWHTTSQSKRVAYAKGKKTNGARV